MQQMVDRKSEEESRPTIYDVAERAGTSVSTVSRVVNGSSLVGSATTKAVNDAMADLGFVPRRIRRQAGRTVLNIVVFLPRGREPAAHIFYDATALFAGIRMGLGPTRAHTIAVLSDEMTPFEGKKLGDIDGCIFAFGEPSTSIRALLAERGIPCVLINRRAQGLPSVSNDARHGSGLLAAAIATHRPSARPVFVSVDSAAAVAKARFDGLRDSDLRLERGARSDYESVSSIGTSEVAKLLKHGFDTLICVNDLVAVAALERLALLGIRVPDEVSVTGYDNAPVRGLVSRDVTSVDLEVERLGEEAARLLCEAIMERRTVTNGVEIPGRLIPGNTV